MYTLEGKADSSDNSFRSFTPELRTNTLRNFIDSYDRLPKNGQEISVSDYLLNNSELEFSAEELGFNNVLFEYLSQG